MENLESFGKALYEFRISKNINLDKISQITKINQEHFIQFEKGDFSRNHEIYIRLFLREYIKCIDCTQLDQIMDKFDIAYNGKINKKKLTFIPDENESIDSNVDNEPYNMFNNYTPQYIAVIIFTFLAIIFIFRLVMYFSYQN